MVISVQCVLLSIPLPICEPTCHPCSGPSVPGTGWLSSCMFNPLPLLIFAVNLCPPFHSRQFVWLSRQHLYICCALKLRKYPLGCWCSVVQSVSPHLPSAGFVGRSNNIRFFNPAKVCEGMCAQVCLEGVFIHSCLNFFSLCSPLQYSPTWANFTPCIFF